MCEMLLIILISIGTCLFVCRSQCWWPFVGYKIRTYDSLNDTITRISDYYARQINNLNKEKEALHARIDALSKEYDYRVMQLENPPKYKKGDLVKGYIITDVKWELGGRTVYNLILNLTDKYDWQYYGVKKGGQVEKVEV